MYISAEGTLFPESERYAYSKRILSAARDTKIWRDCVKTDRISESENRKISSETG